jgi:putative two-component system response regulator
MITLVDSFDAMANPRPYRAALAPSLVIDELTAGAGLQFDPELTALFVDLLQRTPGAFGFGAEHRRAA